MQKSFAMFALLLAITPPAIAGKKATFGELESTGYESILATKDQTPRFTFHAPKGLNAAHFLGGAVGVFTHVKAAERGSKILVDYKITEPATDIAKGLASHLGERLKLASDFKDSGLASSVSASHFTLRNAKDLAGEYGPGKLVVNVGTLSWTLMGAGDSKFRILYSAKAQLVDTDKQTVLASAECMFPLKKADSARDASTMFNNEAASLKAEFQEVAEFCTNKFKADLLVL